MTDRRFGMEFKIAGSTIQRAAKALRIAGFQAATESSAHTTRNHWKAVSDSSVRDGFEVVSPIFQGKSALEDVRTAITALNDARDDAGMEAWPYVPVVDNVDNEDETGIPRERRLKVVVP